MNGSGRSERARGLAAALAVLAPVLLAGCAMDGEPPIADGPGPAHHASYGRPAGTIIVHSGDTLSEIALSHGVRVSEIVRLNRLRDRDRIYAGQVLRIPEHGDGDTYRSAPKPAARSYYAAYKPAPRYTNPARSTPVERQTLPESRASLLDRAQDVIDRFSGTPPAPALQTASLHPRQTTMEQLDGQHFVWPVQGQIIMPFGPAPSGERNDGINIATKMGTPIHAAADGTVTYAGNELKGYGNLILIKHNDGYITAYAHAERLIVARGDRVRQGQVIGYAGDTGDVREPQLHFEIRRGVEPVDPKPLLVARAS